MDEIKTCIDRPPVSSTAARMFALTERPSNAPMIDPSLLPAGVDRTQMLALPTGKLWKPGRVLRVRFLDGDPAIQTKLQPFAHIWSQHCSIKFVFGDDPDAEIRISFKDRGSWSYVGTDCLGVPKNQATMNFGWLRRDTSDEEYSRVVTHEFGHALGCIHEHQNPATNIPWDKPKVYAYYAGPPNNWTNDQVGIDKTPDANQQCQAALDPQRDDRKPPGPAPAIGEADGGQQIEQRGQRAQIDRQIILHARLEEELIDGAHAGRQGQQGIGDSQDVADWADDIGPEFVWGEILVGIV